MTKMKVVVVFEYDDVESGSSNDGAVVLKFLTTLDDLESRYNADTVFVREVEFEGE
jgi:hypothetical protein